MAVGVMAVISVFPLAAFPEIQHSIRTGRSPRGDDLTSNEHRPIPIAGTRVRFYLNGAETDWVAALLKGTTTPDANDNESVFRPDARLSDAGEILELQSPPHNYVLSLEEWAPSSLSILPLPSWQPYQYIG